ncbi:polysaccharide biosynthesis tyrosine autokinase [Bradyrhizobium erythrophlei]|nr:polysaccharide biosynthesis tyrosine autokinase [Bradyrhizobium erythrophlei]
MLQLLKPEEREIERADYVSPDQMFAAALGFVRRQYPIFLVTMLITLALGAAYLVITRSTYTAQATIIIDTRKLQPYSSQNSLFTEVPVDSPAVDSQLELIKSDNIARSVIRDLHLAQEPEFSRYGGGFVGNLLYYFYQLFEPGDESQDEIERRALREFSNNLSAKRVGVTYVIEISYRSALPERAAQVANAVAEAYINDQLDAKYQSARRAGDWLSTRIQELKQQAISADRSIVDFKSKNNIVDAGGRSISEQQVAELNSQLLAARTVTADARARLDRIEQVMKSDVRDATVTDTLRSDVVSKLRTQYLDIANREADLSARYGVNHLAAVNLRNQMREIAKSITAELGRLAETYKSDYEIAKQREDEAQRALEAAVARSQIGGQAQVQLKELESNSQTYRSMYETFLQRYTESIQQQSFPITEARIISSAGKPSKRSSPKTILVLSMACAGGLMLGFGIGLMRDLSDRVVRTSDQVERLLGADCLATLPVLPAAALQPNDTPLSPHEMQADVGAFWAVVSSPFSRYAEGIRSIKSAIDLNSRLRSGRVVGLSSALPGEGKSTTAAGLALLSAQAGHKVILIDADLRNPSLTKLMAPNAAAGLVEVALGERKFEDVVLRESTTGLDFLPAVIHTPIAHTSEILASEGMRALIERFSNVYDYIIIDLSPLAPVIDVRATGHFIPTYLLVLEWGKTNIDVLERALANARAVRENLLGVVMNKADTDLLKRYEGYGTSYYYDPKYSQPS